MANSSLREDLRFKVLRTLENNPNISHRQLANEIGVSVGAVNYCMRALIDKGHLKVQNFRTSKNRLAYAYLLTPRGIREKSILATRFLNRKLNEYNMLRKEIEAVRAEIDGQNNSSDAATDQEDGSNIYV